MKALNTYLTRLASADPTPGGGSAALVVAAFGCALLGMVARICSDGALAARADTLRADLLHRATLDEAAFRRVVAAQALPRDGEPAKERRREALQRALADAAAEPLAGAASCLDVLRMAADALQLRNRNLVSDVACAAEFAHAGLLACAYNVRINHRLMKDFTIVSAQRTRLDAYEREGTALIAALRKTAAADLAP